MNTDAGQRRIRAQANGAVTHRAALKCVGQVSGLLDLAVATASTDKVVGFALEAAADDAIFSVCVGGPCEAIAGATITAGTHEFLTPMAAGALTPYAGGDRAVAYFLGALKGTATAASGDVILVDVLHIPIDLT